MDTIVPCLSVLILILSAVFYIAFYPSRDIISLCQNSKRPVIYGEDFCDIIYENKIIRRNDVLLNIVNIFSPKTVIRGQFGSESLILKTLVSKQGMTEVEDLFYSVFHGEEKYSKDFIKLEIVKTIMAPSSEVLLSKLTLCPLNVNVDNFLNKIPNFDKYSPTDYFHLWTVVQVNPEPLILKLLRPPRWPVPRYFGVCGRLLAVQDCGPSLTLHYTAPWSQRADYSRQLLQAAFQFTFADPQLAFYLTDISPDNIAVNAEGVVTFIDLENVIVVDKTMFPFCGVSSNHTSSHYRCTDCYIFEPVQICSHPISDHNIYAVCKELLSDSWLLPGGLLHSAPPSVASQLTRLIEECVTGHTATDTKVTTNRFTTATTIISALTPLLQ